MPDITLTIPTLISNRVADAFVFSYPPPAGTDVSTPVLKLAYVRTLLLAHIKSIVVGYEASQAITAVQKTAADKAAAEINLI